MGIQTIVNFLNESDNETSKFPAKKWFVIHNKNSKEYSNGNDNDTSIKLETETIESFFCLFKRLYSSKV